MRLCHCVYFTQYSTTGETWTVDLVNHPLHSYLPVLGDTELTSSPSNNHNHNYLSLLFFSSNLLPIGHPSAEIQLKIVKNLDQVSSACLGLACKAFYPLHKELRGITPLHAWYYLAPYAMLEERLETWAGPELWYQFATRKFWWVSTSYKQREEQMN